MKTDSGKSKVAVELLSTNPFLQFEQAALTLNKYVANVIRDPAEPKYRRIRLENATFDRNVRQPRGGIRFLEALGFHEVNGFLELEQPDNTLEIQQALELLLAKVEAMRLAEQQKVAEERAKIEAERRLKDDAKRQRLAMIADDKEARKDPNWKPAVAAGANKAGKAVTGFGDVGVDLNGGGG